MVLGFPVEAVGKGLEDVGGETVDLDGIGDVGESTEFLEGELTFRQVRKVFGDQFTSLLVCQHQNIYNNFYS